MAKTWLWLGCLFFQLIAVICVPICRESWQQHHIPAQISHNKGAHFHLVLAEQRDRQVASKRGLSQVNARRQPFT